VTLAGRLICSSGRLVRVSGGSGVRDKSEGRLVGVENADFLGLAIVNDGEIVLRKAGDGVSVLVVDDDVELDETRGDVKRRHSTRVFCRRWRGLLW
jgi:hypothetical protein